MRGKKFNYLFYIGLFIILYQPTVLPFNTIHIVGILSIMYVVFFSSSKLGRIKRERKVEKLYFIFVMLLFYLLFISVMINKGPITNISFPIYFIMDIIPFSYAVKIYSDKHYIKEEEFWNLFIVVGICQAIFAIVAFFVPTIQQFFIERMISYGYSSSLDYFSSFRMYGFSPFLTFGTPVIQSVLSVIVLFYRCNKKVSDYVYALIILFSALINARISIIIVFLGFFAFLLSQKISIRKKIFYSITCIVLFALSVNVGAFLLKMNSPLTYEWITNGIKEIEIAIGIKEADNYSYVTYFTNQNIYKIPDDLLGKLFGKGCQVMTGRNSYNINSDVGYINDIWLGGFIYVLILYGSFLKIIWKIFKNKNIVVSQIGLFFLLLYPILNIKGIVFTMMSLSNFLVILYIFINKPNKIKKKYRNNLKEI